MYNTHRGMAPAPNNRLNELLEQIRAEFDNQQNRSGEYEQQITAQLQEMEIVRQKLYTLEQNQHAIKQRYDEEVNRLRHELELRGGPTSHMGGPGHGGAPHPQPPNIGNGQGTSLFGTIIANPAGPGGPGLAPPPQEQQQQGPPQHQMPQPQPGPQAPQQPPFSGYPPNGYPAGTAQPPASPGPKRGGRGPPGPNTPQQNQHQPYPDARGSPQIARPTPPPPQARVPDFIGNQLADLNPEHLAPQSKREGDDWFAIFNPRVPRVLDVELLHNLQHESVVCCVRFSQDGQFVATGCNRSAQIYDVNTGRQVTILQDETVDKDGDLYIRSVCFSPDGRYLATGAEDKQIRVWDIATRTIKHTFSGHEQDIYSLDFARNGRHIASGSGDRTVRVWDIESGCEILCLQIEDGVTTVAMSPDGSFVAAGSLDKSVRVWDTRAGNLLERLDGVDGHKDSVYSVAFAPSGRELVSGSLDKTIKMWELGDRRGMGGHASRGGKCIRTFEGHKDFVLSVALTIDGAWVLSGSKDRGVQFWDPATGNVQLMLQGHKNSVISVAPSPQGPLFATGSGDMRARIWKYKPWRP